MYQTTGTQKVQVVQYHNIGNIKKCEREISTWGNSCMGQKPGLSEKAKLL